MNTVTTIAETRAAVRALRANPNASVGLVPTMGALHAGHLSLVRAARQTCTHVAVSIFVNPTQFAPTEDLDRYPRTLTADIALLQAEDVDLLFAPTPLEIYPTRTPNTTVDPGPLGTRLDGRSRPGHFRGVATVVTKLLNILQPDHAFFGQKDAAQVAVLRALLHDLNSPVAMQVHPIVRDLDGLALSSRNRFLTPDQRHAALAIPQALACASRRIQHGERQTAPLLRLMANHLNAPDLRLDYLEAVHADTLLPQNRIDPHTLIAVAAYVGKTRLIDNLLARDILPPPTTPTR